MVAPMYIAETAEPAVRGALSSLLLVMFNLGLFAVYAAGTPNLQTLLLKELLGPHSSEARKKPT